MPVFFNPFDITKGNEDSVDIYISFTSLFLTKIFVFLNKDFEEHSEGDIEYGLPENEEIIHDGQKIDINVMNVILCQPIYSAFKHMLPLSIVLIEEEN